MRLINKLGIGLVSLGLLGTSDYTSNSLLENRVNAAEQAKHGQTKNAEPVEFKENYTFDEVKTALGERYSRLNDKQKKTVEKNFKEGRECVKIQYNSFIGAIYNKEIVDSMSKEEIEELEKFKISKLKKEVLDEYLQAYPWIKRENLVEIDKNPKNPDKILLYHTEDLRQIEGFGGGMFDDLGKAYVISQGLIDITDGLKKVNEFYNLQQKIYEKNKKEKEKTEKDHKKK